METAPSCEYLDVIGLGCGEFSGQSSRLTRHRANGQGTFERVDSVGHVGKARSHSKGPVWVEPDAVVYDLKTDEAI
jgi:hypothetical protein